MYYIGIDIGGTNLKAGLVDEGYRIVATHRERLDFHSMEQMGDVLAKMALTLVEKAGIDKSQVASVGMGFPGPVDDRKGVVIKTVNIPIRFMPVAEMFHRHWAEVPVHLGNDADCAALGEYYHYEDKNIESLILVTLGTGIGTGIILNGRIHTGINGCAGEGGHIVIVHGGEPCTCGRRGCWEAYSSATALIRQARQAAAEHPESLLAGAEEITGKTVFDAADRGDETANAVVDRFCDYLGAGVTNIVNALAPEVILIGGGISRQGERLLAPVRRYVEKNCFGGKDGAIPIIAAARLGNDAGIIGAAAL